MKNKPKLFKRVLGIVMVVVAMISTLLSISTPVFASNVVFLDEVTGYSYTGVSPHLGYAITHAPSTLLK